MLWKPCLEEVGLKRTLDRAEGKGVSDRGACNTVWKVTHCERTLLNVLNGNSKIYCFCTWGLSVKGV